MDATESVSNDEIYEIECPFCCEKFSSVENSCPQNIESHKMCKKCVEDSKKFFGNFPGCYFCGDRRPMVVIEEHQDTENRLQGNRITITRILLL